MMEKRNLICHKCNKHEWKCKCEDKELRLSSFRFELSVARIHVLCGGYSDEDRRMVDKWGF